MSQEPADRRDDQPDAGPDEGPTDGGPLTVDDDQLPEDLRPSDDNPLAQPADDDVPDDLLAQQAEPATSGRDSEGDSPTGVGDAPDTSPAGPPSDPDA